jgi:hypothetical protein
MLNVVQWGNIFPNSLLLNFRRNWLIVPIIIEITTRP